MKDKQAKYPQLRFKGFTDPWVQRKLSELASVTDTKHATAPVIDVVTKYRMIRTSSVRNGFLNENKTDSVTEETYEKWSERIRLQEGDVVFSREAPIGESAVIPKSDNNFFLGQRMVGIRTNENLNPAFLNETFLAPRFRKEVNVRNAESTTVANFGIPDIKRYEINVPSIEEQEKIGKLLDGVNNLIAANQRKLDLLKEQKKGYLQKMFPKNGAKVPELQFAGFADAWEQRKLGEEAQLTMGQSPNSENYTKNPDDYILVQGNADMKNGRVVPRVWTTQITKKAEKSDLILSVRAPVGDIGKTDYDVVLGRGVAAIKGNEFIFQQLGKMKLTGYWTRYSTGSTFESINSNDIKDAKIMVPVEEEQQKIGAFFKQLDDTIVLHQRKLDLLKEQKKGFLQKMFV